MTIAIPFQTRARTIDHLGRGQIADAPTAISELWKNAYDAYARNVALHIFSGQNNIAAIFDDGVGMDYEDIVQRWLVIGTESKIEQYDKNPVDTLGLPFRLRQGEKGIGRLSIAFLAPCTILISKKKTSDFIAVLVDWRLFENPFISLSDIHLPVQQFVSSKSLADGISDLTEIVRSNLGNKNGDDREKRLAEGWRRFSEYELNAGTPTTTAATIKESWKSLPLNQKHLEEWPVYLGLAEHGTAMFMSHLNYELNVWVSANEETDEVQEVKDRLRQTLTGFIDPYTSNHPEFDYEVLVNKGGHNTRILSGNDVFGIDGFRDLEHSIEGGFDDKGNFSGRIVAFGQDLGIKTFVPRRPPSTKGREKLGGFMFSIGTYEVDERRSTLNELQHALVDAQAEKYAGIALYRDFLRVMPYGRPDADFLGMEERRSKNAGREFWAHRRSFGRIAVSREGNPALRDKAGREGLVDNQAFRQMRLLVVEFLKDAARKYFGSDSAVRQEIMPGIMARKALQKEAADQARMRRRKSIRQFLKDQSGPLEEALSRAQSLVGLAEDTLANKDRVQATVLTARARDLRNVGERLRPPMPPSKLGDIEDQWRLYRDKYQELLNRISEVMQMSARVESTLAQEDPEKILQKYASEQATAIGRFIDSFGVAIESRFSELRSIWRNHQIEDKKFFDRKVEELLIPSITLNNLLNFMNLIDVNRTEASENASGKYRSFINTLDQLIEGIDLEGAYSITEDDRSDLEEQLRDIRSVAQVGVTVEIIGHEFETLEAEVRRSLQKLPIQCRNTEAYSSALRAHLSLADRLRFLSPLKIGGYRSRERISGEQIATFTEDFFSKIFVDARIDFIATRSFRDIKIVDIPSRIYPVFINLINNAVYWVSLSTERKIKIDFEDGLVVIADTGPGVDPEDVHRLFDLFFSKRRSGRGVGLYLSRANLAVAGHRIRYADKDDPKILEGANFIIQFKGVV